MELSSCEPGTGKKAPGTGSKTPGGPVSQSVSFVAVTSSKQASKCGLSGHMPIDVPR